MVKSWSTNTNESEPAKIKTMLIEFFDSKNLIHCEFVPIGQTVNAKFYLEVMKHLMCRIHRIQSEYRHPDSLTFLHVNAPTHTATLNAFLRRKSDHRLVSSALFPNLAPVDYFSKAQSKDERPLFDETSTIQRTCA